MMNRERMTGSSRYRGGNAPTSLGLSERWERVLAYPLGWVTGLILFVLERRNQNVQLHAKQSMIVFGPLSIVYFLVGLLASILGGIPLIGGFLGLVLGFLASVVLWIMIVLAVWLIIMAWFRPTYRLPFVSNWLRY
ncbi:MAG TPA: hypothetical protein VHD63_18975 [Ktedonobacteraceae bacterium]|nr:hypothetical protein [Ktedonobacteraceae bacterium]